MAKRLKWDGSVEVVAKYAEKDRHGQDIDVQDLQERAAGATGTYTLSGEEDIDANQYAIYRDLDGEQRFASAAEATAFKNENYCRNVAFLSLAPAFTISPSQGSGETYLVIKENNLVATIEELAAKVKTGADFYVIQTEYPDRWAYVDKDNLEDGITFYKLETAKLDSYVDKTSSQIITGSKEFAGGILFRATGHSYGIRPGVYTEDSLEFTQDGAPFMTVLDDISFAENLVPIGTKDLGSSTAKWQNLYLSGTSNAKEYVQMDGSYGIKIYKDEYNKTCVSHTSNGGTSWAKACELGDYMVDTYSVRPLSTAQYDIGSSTRLYKDLYISNGINWSASTKIYLNASNSNLVVENNFNPVQFREDVNPLSDNLFSLGNSNYHWKDLYLAGNITDGTNSIPVANIGVKRSRSNVTGATATIASAGSLTDYFMTNSSGITSLSVTAYSAASGDSNPYWSFSFIAASGFSISLPSGTTWSDGAPVFIAGREYRVIVHAGMAANAYKAHLIED